MSKEGHPEPAVLERLMRGELRRPEMRGVVRHLLTGCPKCIAVTRGFWERGERSPGLKGVLEKMSSERLAGAR